MAFPKATRRANPLSTLEDITIKGGKTTPIPQSQYSFFIIAKIEEAKMFNRPLSLLCSRTEYAQAIDRLRTHPKGRV